MATTIREDELHELALERALALPASRSERPFGPEAEVLKVLGKVFLLVTERHGRPILVLKADPDDARMLRENVIGISPGYHMNKRHWITLEADRGDGTWAIDGAAQGRDRLDATLLEELVTDSYRLVVAALPRARRPIDPETFEAPEAPAAPDAPAAPAAPDAPDMQA
ncbi:MmcQ/YjbR family DNA-binding protein [Brachybacterium sp. DNPG3]